MKKLLTIFCLFICLNGFGQTQNISLLSPIDESQIQVSYPFFSWTTISNTSQGLGDVFYKFKLVEIYEGQLPTYALQNNVSIYEEEITNSSSLLYPILAPEIQNCKSYVWHIIAEEDIEVEINEQTVIQRSVIGQSDVFSFNTNCPSSQRIVSIDNYILLDHQPDPFVFFIPNAAGGVKFKYNESHQNDTVMVKINGIDGSNLVNLLPQNYQIDTIKYGANFINIPFSDFAINKVSYMVYFLEVSNQRGELYKSKIRFE